MSIENYEKVAESAVDDMMDMLQKSLVSISHPKISRLPITKLPEVTYSNLSEPHSGEAVPIKNRVNHGRFTLYEDMFDDMDQKDGCYKSKMRGIKTTLENICDDWRNKAVIRMMGVPEDAKGAYMGLIESRVSDFIINRNLNWKSSEGAAYMGYILKLALVDMRSYVPKYGLDSEEKWHRI